MPIHLKTTPQEAAAKAARRKRKTKTTTSWLIDEESRIYENVPQRWRTTFDEFLHADPDCLDEDDYAEWVRTGMYRKAHRKEYEEEQRVKEEHRKEQAEQRKERAEHHARQRALKRKAEQDLEQAHLRKLDAAREEYDLRWQTLLTNPHELTFRSIPWPIFAANTDVEFGIDDITSEAISAFILSKNLDRKEKLREAFLRFHPDKFEGRFMNRVVSQDQQIVKEALGRVIRVLNDLMAERTI